MEEAEEYQTTSEEIRPIRQEIIEFYGKSLIGVILPDERPGVVLRSFCENLQLDRVGQVRRIKRTEAIADDLISNVRIEYPDGPAQHAHVLLLHAVAYWLATIDTSRVRPDVRPDILHYQKKAVDALYVWAQSWRSLPTPTNQTQALLLEPEASLQTEVGHAVIAFLPAPGPGASHAELATYHENMALWHRYQADHHAQQWRGEVEEWRGSVEDRLEGDKELLQLIPDMMERLGPETISPLHQGQLRGYVKLLHTRSGMPYQTIYDDLRLAFGPARYQDLLESDWPQIEAWFKVQIEQATQRKS